MDDATGTVVSCDADFEQVVAIVSAAYERGADNAKLGCATRLYEDLRQRPDAHRCAVALADVQRRPEVQHFGFQVLLASLQASRSAPAQAVRAELKAWIVGLLRSERWAEQASFVRGKCAEVVAELARLDWPVQWPELKPALLAACGAPSAGPVVLALGVWSKLGDLIIEDAKDLVPSRKRAICEAMAWLMENPTDAPELVSCIELSLRRHGGNRAVVSEALGVCRALANVVPVQVLLRHGLDKIVQVGLGMQDLRTQALFALAEWVEQLCPKGAQSSPAAHDLCRFVAMLVRLSQECRFDGDQQTYSFHKQVAELFADLCERNAASMCFSMQGAELRQVWGALMHFVRYPSITIQIDALSGMLALAKAFPVSSGSGSPPRPPLQELLALLFANVVKIDSLPTGDLEESRSAWLLQCLGHVSASESVQSFRAWRQLLECTRTFDICDGEAGSEERGALYGKFKGKVLLLLNEVCKPTANPNATEGYASLCHHLGQLVGRCLAAVWEVEFEAVIALIERTGPALLREAESKVATGDAVALIVAPSLEFLRRASADASAFSCPLELKRMDLLSHWAPFYKHFSLEVLEDILKRVTMIAGNSSDSVDGQHLQRRALDCLVSLGRSGSLQPRHIEALQAECDRLAPKLTPGNRGKLYEAVAAAVSFSAVLPLRESMRLVERIMEEPTQHFLSSALVQPGASEVLAAALARSAQAGDGSQDPELASLKSVRTLLRTFHGVVSRSMVVGRGGARAAGGEVVAADDDVMGGGAARGEEARSAQVDVGGLSSNCAARVVQTWAPGVFACLLNLAGLWEVRHTVGDALTAVATIPADNELTAMLGRKLEDAEEIPVLPPLDPKKIRDIRNILWELRITTSAAVRDCISCFEFWSLPQAIELITRVAEAIPLQRPHHAEMLLKDIFVPLFGYGVHREGHGLSQVPAAQHAHLCSAVVPPLVAGLDVLLAVCWGRGEISPHSMVVPSALDNAMAQTVVSLSRVAAQLIGALAGVGSSSQMCLMANPEKRVFRGQDGGASAATSQAASAVPQAKGGKNKRKQRNRNSFAALSADIEEFEGSAPCSAVDAADPQVAAGASLFVLHERALREAVRRSLVGLLDIPEPETLRRSLLGLNVWTAQVWNSVARGDDLAAVSLGSGPGPADAGRVLHAASDVLRILPTGIFQPVAQLLVEPPSAMGSRVPSVSAQPRSGALVITVQQSWSSYGGAQRVNGKPAPSLLVCDASAVVFAVLVALTRLFRLQCRKLKLQLAISQLYLCPMLFEVVQAIRKLRNTSEADANALLETFLDESSTDDQRRSAVRALLHEASAASAAVEGGGV